MKGYRHEVFVLLLLDSRNQLLDFHELFKGTTDMASVYPPEIVKLALQNNTAAAIVAHNHPSSVAEPSQSDIAITKRIKQALALVDISLLDHFIVGCGEVTSFADTGQM